MNLVDHEVIACEMAGACSGDVQFLVDPELAAQTRRGDCAIYTPLLCSMLYTAGVPCRMIVVAADAASDRFTHVYAAAVLEDGSLYPLDASHGKSPGWETPNAHRRAVWSVFGLPLW
jgi:transglutaminase-like putative cysteine protease